MDKKANNQTINNSSDDGKKINPKHEIRRFNLRKIESEVGGREALAELCDMDSNRITHIIGLVPHRNIGENVAEYIEKQLKLPQGWLSIDHDEKARAEDLEILRFSTLSRKNVVLLKILDIDLSEKNSMITCSDNINNRVIMRLSTFKELNSNPEDCIILNVMDETMRPTFRVGEELVIDTKKTNIESSKIYAIWLNGKITLRRLFLHDDGVKVAIDSIPHKIEHPDEIIKKGSRLKVIGQALFGMRYLN